MDTSSSLLTETVFCHPALSASGGSGSLSVIAACPQSFWFFRDIPDERE
jgi:hypothetical protein